MVLSDSNMQIRKANRFGLGEFASFTKLIVRWIRVQKPNPLHKLSFPITKCSHQRKPFCVRCHPKRWEALRGKALRGKASMGEGVKGGRRLWGEGVIFIVSLFNCLFLYMMDGLHVAEWFPASWGEFKTQGSLLIARTIIWDLGCLFAFRNNAFNENTLR